MPAKKEAYEQGYRMVAASQGRQIVIVSYTMSRPQSGTWYDAVWADHAERIERNVAASLSRRTFKIIDRLN